MSFIGDKVFIGFAEKETEISQTFTKTKTSNITQIFLLIAAILAFVFLAIFLIFAKKVRIKVKI
jgi:flagellar biogenesis protein FliO